MAIVKEPNPLPCGCGIKGTSSINPTGDRIEYEDMFIDFCPLHGAAAGLLSALRVSAEYAHTAGGTHAPNFVGFDECRHKECVSACEAIRKAEGK